MSTILVVYATKEGHTAQIAQRVAADLTARGLDVMVQNTDGIHGPLALEGSTGVIVAASVHLGSHERSVVRFVKEHRVELERLPTAFISVSMAEANIEDSHTTPERRAEAVSEVDAVLGKFFDQTGWHPMRVKAVAGALLYTHYGLLKKFVLKRVSRSKGGDTDTSRDYVYTDWTGLDRFVDSFVELLPTREPAQHATIQ